MTATLSDQAIGLDCWTGLFTWGQKFAFAGFFYEGKNKGGKEKKYSVKCCIIADLLCCELKCDVLGEPFQKVQLEVHKLLSDRIVVGHSLKNDFKASL